jgi:hypothetical protein
MLLLLLLLLLLLPSLLPSLLTLLLTSLLPLLLPSSQSAPQLYPVSYILPPTRSRASTTVTLCPMSTNCRAAARPEIPAPTMRTCRGVGLVVAWLVQLLAFPHTLLPLPPPPLLSLPPLLLPPPLLPLAHNGTSALISPAASTCDGTSVPASVATCPQAVL